MILGQLYDLAVWPHPWPWPWSFKSKSEIALSQEWGDRLTWNGKNVSHPFMTMILTSVTMVGWADVPDNDRGDFRSWRIVDISSYCLDPNLSPYSWYHRWIIWCVTQQCQVHVMQAVPAIWCLGYLVAMVTITFTLNILNSHHAKLVHTKSTGRLRQSYWQIWWILI